MYLGQLKELYRYRSLVWNLVMRELKARYRGSTLGFLWSFLHPLLLISVYTLVFSVYLRFGMDDYIVSFASGLLPWMWFSSSLLEASNSILAGGNLIKKVLFPAGVLPLVVVLSNFVNFLLSLPILLLFVVFFNRPIGLSIMGLPIVMLIQLVFTTGLAFMFSALCVHYRDVQHILANLLNLWFFLTPIIYPPEQVSGFLRIIISLNPVAPLILAYRSIFYKNLFPSFMQLSIVAAMAILIYLLGASIFERYSVIFAEEV
jgi:ABC-type polysaccharide/polyol phosphate export permease